MTPHWMVRARHIVATASAAALVLTMAACGGGDEQAEARTDLPAAEQTLYDAALAEPALSWYTAQIPELDEAAVEGFKERYPGLEVEYLRLASADLSTRYAQERTSGADPAGLVTNADPQLFAKGAEDGWFETEQELPALQDFPEDFYADGVATVGILPYYLNYNTQRVSEDDAPESWEDLLSPQLKGEVALSDPRASFSYMGLMEILRDEYGDDYLEGLAGQDLELVPSAVPGSEALASGGIGVLAPNVQTIVQPLIDKGAPIELVEVSPTTGSEYLTAVATETASPSSARLLMNYLLSEEGQSLFNGEGGSSPLGEVGDTTPLPDGYQPPPLEDAAANRGELLGLLGLS